MLTTLCTVGNAEGRVDTTLGIEGIMIGAATVETTLKGVGGEDSLLTTEVLGIVDAVATFDTAGITPLEAFEELTREIK